MTPKYAVLLSIFGRRERVDFSCFNLIQKEKAMLNQDALERALNTATYAMNKFINEVVEAAPDQLERMRVKLALSIQRGRFEQNAAYLLQTAVKFETEQKFLDAAINGVMLHSKIKAD